MAYSALHYRYKAHDLKCKEDTARIKRYSSAHKMTWSHDIRSKSQVLQDILKCNNKGDSDEINKLIEEIKLKDEELEKSRAMYKALAEKLKALESKDGRRFLSNADGNFDDILKERDQLKEELSKLSNMNDFVEKLKVRASQADEMEEEIARLKSDLQKCTRGGSGDKLSFQPSRVSSDSQCNKCTEYAAELKRSKSMLELKEQKFVEVQAERNFLLQRAEMIRCMEAELLLYKTKFEEYECKLLNLKEVVVKAELNEMKLKESQCKLKMVECQLQESEQQNKCLIEKIEQLDMNLRERENYIESSLNPCNPSRRAIEVEPGKVQSIIKQMSKECSQNSTCRCNIENCHCAAVSKVPCVGSNESKCNENVIKNEYYTQDDCQQNDVPISLSEADRLKAELSCTEVRLLRQQNEEFDKEIRRLKDQLSSMNKVIEDIEKERSSNCNLETEINDLKKRHSRELEEVNSTFRTSLCQKLSEMESMERKLVAQIEAKCELERRLEEAQGKCSMLCQSQEKCDELSKSFQTLETCHKERLKEMESLKCEMLHSHDENVKLNKKLKELSCELEELKAIKKRDECAKNSSKDQRSIIKKSVMELKKFHDEKAFLIKSYEKKIRLLESENEGLKCFREKYLFEQQERSVKISYEDVLYKKLASFGMDSLTYEDLTELHSRVKNAMMKLTKVDDHAEVNYSKIIDDLCQKYNIAKSKEMILNNFPDRDMDECSFVTFPKVQRKKKQAMRRTQSISESTKKSIFK